MWQTCKQHVTKLVINQSINQQTTQENKNIPKDTDNMIIILQQYYKPHLYSTDNLQCNWLTLLTKKTQNNDE